MGCTTIGKKSAKETSARSKIENVDSLITSNLRNKFDQLANIHYGVDYALSKEDNPSKNVEVAKNLNHRAISLSGAPSIDDVKRTQKMVDDLVSELRTERQRGLKALEMKDGEIYTLQVQSQALVVAREAEIKKYMKMAADIAARADLIQDELDKMNRYLGLGAVFYGLKKFTISVAWILGIGSILYLVLRFASMSNPLAASIFSIVDIIMSWFVNMIRIIAPKSLEVAGQTASTIANKYRNTMVKMIDGIQYLKEKQKEGPEKKYTLDELLTEFSKLMNDEEKFMIEKVKKDIGYK